MRYASTLRSKAAIFVMSTARRVVRLIVTDRR